MLELDLFSVEYELRVRYAVGDTAYRCAGESLHFDLSLVVLHTAHDVGEFAVLVPDAELKDGAPYIHNSCKLTFFIFKYVSEYFSAIVEIADDFLGNLSSH